MTLKINRHTLSEIANIRLINLDTGEGYILPIKEIKNRNIGKKLNQASFDSETHDALCNFIQSLYKIQNLSSKEFEFEIDFPTYERQ